jgi:competence protein ComGC
MAVLKMFQLSLINMSDSSINYRLSRVFTLISLFFLLLVPTIACEDESSSNTRTTTDTRIIESSQTVVDQNGQTLIQCSGNATSTAAVNGQEFRCENGQITRVR